MAKGIVQISIGTDDSDYLLTMEDEDGEIWEFTMSLEQLDLLSEAIGEHLDAGPEEVLLVAESGDDR